jgi:hypothetical protein
MIYYIKLLKQKRQPKIQAIVTGITQAEMYYPCQDALQQNKMSLI